MASKVIIEMQVNEAYSVQQLKDEFDKILASIKENDRVIIRGWKVVR